MALSKVTEVMADIPMSVKLVGTTVVSGLVLTAAWKGLWTYLTYSKKVYPKDTIIIHQLGRGPCVPSLTPFAIKLETFFRMEGIPYVNEHNLLNTSRKTGKIPFMEYNGEEVPDSEFILEFLSKEKKFDLNRGLSPEQIGIGRAFQKMVEENTYWCMVADRWILDDNCTVLREAGAPRILWPIYKSRLLKQLHGQGIGRHPPEKIRHIMSEDLKALSNFLGSKKFFFGDKACKFDCAIFGILAELRWALFGGLESVIREYP
ncbi:failed axon connections homolog [Pecten maximus]|uniref:failed axon connections homolog n=1 Tax=Pecten maximus TaxID=6579 RepID=UPI0014589DDD|nr:failed axon connections homolog [Pecten maximus]